MEGLFCPVLVIVAVLFGFKDEIEAWWNKPSQQQVDQQLEDYHQENRDRDDRYNKFYYKIFDKHVNTLINKRMDLVFSDDYGSEDFRAYKKELEYFVDSVVVPLHKKWIENLDFSDKYHIADDEINQKPKWKRVVVDNLLDYINDLWEHENIQKQVKEIKASDEPMPDDPYEFERWIARRMEKYGWKAKATSGSGDQGADVIAEKDGWKVIIQCKMYKSAVGNKAVQEAHAAKTHFNGTHAIVVNSSGTFTKSARELAATSGVKLMHPNDLKGWSPD